MLLRPILTGLLLAALALPGCGGDVPAGKTAPEQERNAAPRPDTVRESVSDGPAVQDTMREVGDTAPEGFEGTAGIVERPHDGSGRAVLHAVRTARHAAFDRVVFEFGGELPGYHVEYIDRPVRECGSGRTVELEGDGWLEVRMDPAQAHTDAGTPTVEERRRRVDLPVLKVLASTCDFEAVVTWVLGVSAPNRYRVLELTDPLRLVIDIRHQ